MGAGVQTKAMRETGHNGLDIKSPLTFKQDIIRTKHNYISTLPNIALLISG